MIEFNNDHHYGHMALKPTDRAFELFWVWLSRPLASKAAMILIAGGIFLLSPPFWIELLNILIAYVAERQIPITEPQVALGLILIVLGIFLIVFHQWVSKNTKNNQVIGLRHHSLGNFPKEAIKADLPYLQRLKQYKEIDIDHSDSYNNGILFDHQSVMRRLEKVPVELDSHLATEGDAPIAYYGLTHIPMAFYLGYLLSDNKYKINLYELNNQSKHWDQLGGIASTLELSCNRESLTPNQEVGDVIVSIGISYPIHHTEIEELDLRNILGHVEINAQSPQRQLITCHEQISQICDEFKATLENIKNAFPHRQRVHVFYAGPVSLCFALGRCISERIDSAVTIYNYSVKESPKYSWSLTINAPNNASAIYTQQSRKGANNGSVQYAQ